MLISLRLNSQPCADGFPVGSISEETAALWVAQLPKGRGGWELKSLHLACTFLGEGGVVALTRTVGDCRHLDVLDVSRNQMTLCGEAARAKLQKLREVWVASGKPNEGLLES